MRVFWQPGNKLFGTQISFLQWILVISILEIDSTIDAGSVNWNEIRMAFLVGVEPGYSDNWKQHRFGSEFEGIGCFWDSGYFYSVMSLKSFKTTSLVCLSDKVEMLDAYTVWYGWQPFLMVMRMILITGTEWGTPFCSPIIRMEKFRINKRHLTNRMKA